MISRTDQSNFSESGYIVIGQEVVTLERKIASLRASIAWAEEQLALTRSFQSEHGWSCAKPNDWIFILDEFEADLGLLEAIADQRVAAA